MRGIELKLYTELLNYFVLDKIQSLWTAIRGDDVKECNLAIGNYNLAAPKYLIIGTFHIPMTMDI